jgi:hypothetical protein
LNHINVNLTTNFLAQHRLRVEIVNMTEGGTSTRYVTVYDQGLSTSQTSNNFWIAIFSLA